mgnify:CR=1 FL=1
MRRLLGGFVLGCRGVAVSDDKDITFAGWRALARWLLESKTGKRFVRWFVKKHWRALLGTEWGAEFHDWVQWQCHRDNPEMTKVIVVEFEQPDTVRVYGVGVSVCFVSRVWAVGRRSEALADELVNLDLPFRARGVFATKNVVAVTRFKVETPRERFDRMEFEKLWAGLEKVGRKYELPRGNGGPGAGG